MVGVDFIAPICILFAISPIYRCEGFCSCQSEMYAIYISFSPVNRTDMRYYLFHAAKLGITLATSWQKRINILNFETKSSD